MADSLKTLTRKTDQPGNINVHWFFNNRHGIVQVALQKKPQDDDAIRAELSAIHHLIMVRNVGGKNRYGRQLTLSVSHGAIRRLYLGTSQKHHLKPWAGTLKTRLKDAVVSVDKHADWLSTPVAAIEKLIITSPPEIGVHMHGVGPVRLTEHVLEQFSQRGHYVSYTNAYKGLMRALKKPEIREVSLPDTERLKKLLKYRNQANCRYYINPVTHWQFVVAFEDDRLPVVVTAYPFDNARIQRTLCDVRPNN